MDVLDVTDEEACEADLEDTEPAEIDSFASASITAPPSKILPLVDQLLVHKIRSGLALTLDWDPTGTAVPYNRRYHVDELEAFVEDFMTPYVMFREVYPNVTYARPTAAVVQEITSWLDKAPRYYDLRDTLCKQVPFAVAGDDPQVEWYWEPCAAIHYDFLDLRPDLHNFDTHESIRPKEESWSEGDTQDKQGQGQGQAEGGWDQDAQTPGDWNAAAPLPAGLDEWE